MGSGSNSRAFIEIQLQPEKADGPRNYRNMSESGARAAARESSEEGITEKDILTCTRTYLLGLGYVQNDTAIENFPKKSNIGRFVKKITVCCPEMSLGGGNQMLLIDEPFFDTCSTHIYELSEEGPMAEELEEDEDESKVVACHIYSLPNRELDPFWESLVFDTDIKQKILSYVSSMMRLSEQGVNTSLVTANRLVLLHGPPGTGKTTLCKAVAQKLAIRMNSKYRKAVLVEINSHSLFSKYFSESGKLVMKMFERIFELLENREALVCVLVDEVESLTGARNASMNRNEPGDAVRVVNALLTQIDHIRKWPNVLILTTSNLSEAVDSAFLDRADLKEYMAPPSLFAIYTVLRSCIVELQRVAIIDCKFSLASDPRSIDTTESSQFPGRALSHELLRVSEKCVGMSGRTLRKLPVLAYSYCLQDGVVSVDEFLRSISKAVDQYLKSQRKIGAAAATSFGGQQQQQDKENRRLSNQIEIDEFGSQ